MTPSSNSVRQVVPAKANWATGRIFTPHEKQKRQDSHRNPNKVVSPATAHIETLRQSFKNEIQTFLNTSGVPTKCSFSFHPELKEAESVYFITGAAFTAYDKEKHGRNQSHAFCPITSDSSESYLMNNTAALLVRLMDKGNRILVHSSNPYLVRELANFHPNSEKVSVIGGDLSEPNILETIYRALEAMDKSQPISNVRMALYQSFAQSNGEEPFKPLHREPIGEVERAASLRLRFIYNMAAMSYDFLVNRNLEDIRIASLSSLAANRASYGLLADGADKFMNELAWRNFHLEANVSTGKPVTLYQINPGITTACDVYSRDKVLQTVCWESIADGFPLDDDVLLGQAPLPSLSANDVAWVVDAVLSTPCNEDPNKKMPETVRSLLYGGFSSDEFRSRLEHVLKRTEHGLAVDPERVFPDHILRSSTEYGALPSPIQSGEYRRISMCPLGQRF